MADFDFTQPFIFDNTDVRGELVSLEESYAHVLKLSMLTHNWLRLYWVS